MPFDIVEAAVQFVFDHSLAAPDSTIVWHSGEPLELPVEWYRQALHRLRGGGRRQELTFRTRCRPTACL
jgi:sulfatase maturation enzyme AslB (radical SAM superfamily)